MSQKKEVVKRNEKQDAVINQLQITLDFFTQERNIIDVNSDITNLFRESINKIKNLEINKYLDKQLIEDELEKLYDNIYDVIFDYITEIKQEILLHLGILFHHIHHKVMPISFTYIEKFHFDKFAEYYYGVLEGICDYKKLIIDEKQLEWVKSNFTFDGSGIYLANDDDDKTKVYYDFFENGKTHEIKFDGSIGEHYVTPINNENSLDKYILFKFDIYCIIYNKCIVNKNFDLLTSDIFNHFLNKTFYVQSINFEIEKLKDKKNK